MPLFRGTFRNPGDLSSKTKDWLIREYQEMFREEMKGRHSPFSGNAKRERMRMGKELIQRGVRTIPNIFGPIPVRDNARGRRKENPLLLEYLNPPARVVGKIPGTLEEIRYHRTGKYRGPFKHAYRSQANIYTVSNGDLLIRARRRGRKLWVDIPD